MKRASLWMLVLGTFCLVLPAGAADNAAVDSAAAFERLKSLAGTWEGTAGNLEKPDPATVQYRVTGQGSALVETQFPGTPHEMVTVYHRDGNDLVLTHYCAAGNQPRMKLDTAASTPDKLCFAFAGGTSFDPAKDVHMHDACISFKGQDRVESDWNSYQNGEKSFTVHFTLARKAS